MPPDIWVGPVETEETEPVISEISEVSGRGTVLYVNTRHPACAPSHDIKRCAAQETPTCQASQWNGTIVADTCRSCRCRSLSCQDNPLTLEISSHDLDWALVHVALQVDLCFRAALCKSLFSLPLRLSLFQDEGCTVAVYPDEVEALRALEQTCNP